MDQIKPARIAILALPETTASVVYGMYDMFLSAGRDWELIVNGSPGPNLLLPQVVSSYGPVLTAGNGVRITPDAGLDACDRADVICVPELLVPPGEPYEGRFLAEIECLKRAYANGKLLATACSGALLLAEAGLLDGGSGCHHALGLLRSDAPPLSARESA